MTRAGIKVSGLVASGKVAARDREDQRKPLVGARPAAAPSIVELPNRGEPTNEVGAARANDQVSTGAAHANVSGPVSDDVDTLRDEALKHTQQLTERDARISERDAIIEELKTSTDRVQRISLADVDDSPFQPRLEYDPEEIDALAKTMAASMQADPIKVRRVNGRYELISGHRRKRAALSLGWTEIDAVVEQRSDSQAELEAMLLVCANEPLSDYELAKMYKRALEKGYCKTREKAAAMFGVTPSAVTGRLSMLELPAPILEMLEAKPRLLGHPAAATVRSLVQEHPAYLDIIVRGVRRLIEEGAKQNALKGWILQAIAQHSRKSAPRENARIVTKDGREVFTTKKTANSVTVSIKARGIDNGQFELDLHKWLKEYANRPVDAVGEK